VGFVISVYCLRIWLVFVLDTIS